MSPWSGLHCMMMTRPSAFSRRPRSRGDRHPVLALRVVVHDLHAEDDVRHAVGQRRPRAVGGHRADVGETGLRRPLAPQVDHARLQVDGVHGAGRSCQPGGGQREQAWSAAVVHHGCCLRSRRGRRASAPAQPRQTACRRPADPQPTPGCSACARAGPSRGGYLVRNAGGAEFWLLTQPLAPSSVETGCRGGAVHVHRRCGFSAESLSGSIVSRYDRAEAEIRQSPRISAASARPCGS